LLWTQDTVAKLKARDFNHVDIENLIEEIESLGKSEKNEIRSRLTTLLEHLLKRIYVEMPQEFNGWERTIRNQRTGIELALIDSSSLKSMWDSAFDIAFRLALRDVKKEYAKQGFKIPDTWQFGRDINTILNIDFWE
jgi:ABC-type proline/glycine betaine transport system ATPase subunit